MKTARHRARESRMRLGRSALIGRLEAVLNARPDVSRFHLADHEDLPIDAVLEAEGLVRAKVEQEAGPTTILAAATHIMRNTRLRKRLLVLRNVAESQGRRVVVATSRSLRIDLRHLKREKSRDVEIGADSPPLQATARASSAFSFDIDRRQPLGAQRRHRRRHLSRQSRP